MKINTINLNYHYPSGRGITDINVLFPEAISIILGPNGSGKSTLLRSISGFLIPTGEIQFNGIKLSEYPSEERESFISFLPQFHPQQIVLTAFEVVLLGRTNSLKWRIGTSDYQETVKLMTELGILNLSDSYLNELSGGQRQLVLIAQALAKNPKVLLMDEPTSSLDLYHQHELFSLIRTLIQSKGISIIISLHDLNLAMRYADYIVFLKDGKMIACGSPTDIISEELITSVYQVKNKVIYDEGVPLIISKL